MRSCHIQKSSTKKHDKIVLSIEKKQSGSLINLSRCSVCSIIHKKLWKCMQKYQVLFITIRFYLSLNRHLTTHSLYLSCSLKRNYDVKTIYSQSNIVLNRQVHLE